ncbi:MAG TPA: glycosyltransferase [Chthonomonadaceae bacterium]|nr:glycosyltransferase [Chthonomonadaceae bacterium]
MKVAMLTTVGERCGIAAYTRALVEGLRTLPEMEVEVVSITEGKQPTEHYVAQAQRLNASDVDVVHIQHEHSFWGGILPGASAFWEMRYLIQKPVVLTAHTTYSLAEMLKIKTERRPHKWLAKRLLLLNKAYRDSVDIAPFTTAITIVHTAAARNELITRGAKPQYVFIVPTGIPAPLPAPTGGQAFRERFGLQGRRLVTLFGYIAYNKGYELTLDILPALPEDVTFVIAGGARNADMEPYAAQLQQRIARSELAERVVVTGFLTDAEVAEAMEASEIVLVPHTQATGSYSVAIPLAHGRPILASDLDCFREIAARVDCLELFRAGDVEDYRAKLQALLDNPARREQLAAGARKYAARYSWPRVAAQTRNVYQTAIQVYAPTFAAQAR